MNEDNPQAECLYRRYSFISVGEGTVLNLWFPVHYQRDKGDRKYSHSKEAALSFTSASDGRREGQPQRRAKQRVPVGGQRSPAGLSLNLAAAPSDGVSVHVH